MNPRRERRETGSNPVTPTVARGSDADHCWHRASGVVTLLRRRAAAFVGRPARADPVQKELDRDEVRSGATPVEQATGKTAS
jgi:hypothetical protein